MRPSTLGLIALCLLEGFALQGGAGCRLGLRLGDREAAGRQCHGAPGPLSPELARLTADDVARGYLGLAELPGAPPLDPLQRRAAAPLLRRGAELHARRSELRDRRRQLRRQILEEASLLLVPLPRRALP